MHFAIAVRWVSIAIAGVLGCAHGPATIENACVAPQWQELAAQAIGKAGATDVGFAIAHEPLVGSVTLAGPARSALALRRMSWLAGTPFEPARFSRMAMAVQRAFVRDGYSDARVVVRDRPLRGSIDGRGSIDVCVAAAVGPRVVIRAFRFPGRTGVDERELIAAIASKDGVDSIGGPYDADRLDASLPAIQDVYLDHGYPAIRVDPSRVRRVGDALEVEVPVHEGKRFKLGALTLASAFGPLRVPLRLATGEWFSRKQMVAERIRLAALTGAKVETNIALDFEQATVSIEFSVEWESPWDALHALPLLSSR